MLKQILFTLKKNLIFMIVVSIMGILIFGVLALVADLRIPDIDAGHQTIAFIENLPPTLVLIPTIMLTVLATLTPFMIFKYRYNNIENEYYHSLPLTKRKLLISHLIAGLIITLVPFFLAYGVGVFIISLGADINFQMLGYLYLFLAAIPFAIGLFAFTSLAITRANRLVDSIVLLVMWSIIPALIIFTPAIIIMSDALFESAWNPMFWIPQMTLVFVSEEVRTYIWWVIPPEQSYYIAYIVFGVVSITSIVLIVVTAKQETSENTQNEMNQWYGYQGLVPIFVASGIMLSGLYQNPAMIALGSVFAGISGYVLHTVQRRSLKIKLIDYILLAIAIILGVLLALVIHYVL